MSPHPTPIDSILRDWSDRRAAPPEQLDRLRIAIAERLADEPVVPQPIRSCRVWTWGRITLSVAATLAAAWLICLKARTARQPDETEKITSSSVGHEAALVLSAADLRRCATLARTMQELFASEWRWVAQSDGHIEIGVLAPNETISETPTRPVLVRLVVLTRPRGAEEWRTDWKTDVLMHSEDFLDFTPDPAHANRLQIWIYPLSDGKLAVDTGVELERPIRIVTQTQTLVNEGKQVAILALSTDAAEYRVMQEVVTLDMWEG